MSLSGNSNCRQSQAVLIRGEKAQRAQVGSARVYVRSHGVKRFIVAVKYEGEKEYRYLMASDLSWRTQDITGAYTLRWLVEVFFEDWKAHEGWAQLTKHPGEEGSSRSLILSLLCDHCLFFHPLQSAQIKHKKPAFTVGSLHSQIQMECLLSVVRDIVRADDPAPQFEKLATELKNVSYLHVSKKHMSGRDMGRLEPTEGLKYKAAA